MSKNIITLAGPPCSGKTTVGEILSRLLRSDYIDLDNLIQVEVGQTIEWIFHHHGETDFRKIEQRILVETISGITAGTVISLGGGTLLNADSRTLVNEKTILFTLTASTATLWERNNGNRPLAEDFTMLYNLINLRSKHYLSLENPINTENKTPDQVAAAIRKAALPLLFPQARPF